MHFIPKKCALLNFKQQIDLKIPSACCISIVLLWTTSYCGFSVRSHELLIDTIPARYFPSFRMRA